jgi:3-methyladenine DNA glycosylase Tag
MVVVCALWPREGTQTRLNWQMALRKRERYREVFDRFDAGWKRGI